MSGTNPLAAGILANIAPLAAGTLAGGPSMTGGIGGLGSRSLRPLRGLPQSFKRQPYLGSAPRVSNAVGFGTGSGAMITHDGGDPDQSQGIVAIKVGLNPQTNTTTVVLFFPVANVANQYVFFADWSSGIAVNIAAGLTYLTCGLSRRLVTGEWLKLAYQWAVSR